MKLSGAEYEIMECIWDLDRAVTSQDILQTVGAAHGWKQPTILTFLSRLVEKGFLTTEKNGKTRSYTAVATRDGYKSGETKDLLARLYGGSVRNLVACMADGDDITREDLDGLRAWLKERQEP